MCAEATTRQVSHALKESVRLVVVHGAGSFGHWQAREHGTKSGWYEDTCAGTTTGPLAHAGTLQQTDEPSHKKARTETTSVSVAHVRTHEAEDTQGVCAETAKGNADATHTDTHAVYGTEAPRSARHVSHSKVQGFAAVRRSVCQLNSTVVSALVKCGVPAAGLPPYPCWECEDAKLKIGRADQVSACEG
jgi:isopentenyl phosphate kinase